MKHRRRQFFVIAVVFVIAAAIFGYIRFFNGNPVFFTTGFDENTVFTAGDLKATKLEAQILISESKVQYEEFLGANIWGQTVDGMTFEEFAKNQVKSKLIRIKCMNLLAKERGVVLDRTETANVEKAASDFMSGLTEDQRQKLGATEAEIKKMYNEFAIAKRLYTDMTSQVVTEISADRARVITIQFIAADSEEKINSAKKRIDSGESFSNIAREINTDSEYEYELKRSEMEAAFEEAAFNLKTGETSGIVRSSDKYYIIKCISDNEKTKTEVNKSAIAEKMKLDSFNKTFESYEASIFINFNDSLWKDLKVSSEGTLNVNFEDIFNSRFD